MNKRIEELSEQAMQYAEHLHGRFHEGHEDPNWDTFVAYEKKFAELIVRECIELCKKQEYDYWRSSEEQDYTPIDCANAIEEHFGVE